MFKKLKPKKGIRVHNPATKLFLPEDGQEVSMSNYWYRRLKEGSVEEVKPIKKTSTKKTSKKVNNSMEVEK